MRVPKVPIPFVNLRIFLLLLLDLSETFLLLISHPGWLGRFTTDETDGASD